jgi:hypothetical protein
MRVITNLIIWIFICAAVHGIYGSDKSEIITEDAIIVEGVCVWKNVIKDLNAWMRLL